MGVVYVVYDPDERDVFAAERAIEGRQGFIWNRAADLTRSQVELNILSAMYAPLMWRDQVGGVVSVDNHEATSRFGRGDLELLLAVAHYAALAVINQQLQEDLRRNVILMQRLLTNFSPRVRDRLFAKAEHGRLRLGGERSEVTILCSDIRGFTRLSASMDAADVVDLLNEYFSALVECIFKHDGTIDKFVGDAILAVFGSPETDSRQHEKAVRAAVGMQAAMQVVSASRTARGQTACDIGIAIHCGEVLHGFIGSPERMEFTVVGDPVNLAARYCDAAPAREILISPAVHERVWRIVDAEETTVPTKHEGSLAAFRLRGIREPSGV